jgi:hypothetical protein
MARRATITLVALLLVAAALAGALWWFYHGQQAAKQPPQYTVVLESNVTPETAQETPLYRVVLQITEGTSFDAIRNYLSATQTQGAVYEFLTTGGRFVAVGPAFQGDPNKIAPALRQAMAPWRNLTKVGTVGSYTIYQGELGQP